MYDITTTARSRLKLKFLYFCRKPIVIDHFIDNLYSLE